MIMIAERHIWKGQKKKKNFSTHFRIDFGLVIGGTVQAPEFKINIYAATQPLLIDQIHFTLY